MKIKQNIQILGIGRYMPSRMVSSEELEKKYSLPEHWIKKKNGILSRRWIEAGETNGTMGAAAAKEALQQAQLSPHDIDLIINASGTNEQGIPDGSIFIQKALGLEGTGIPGFTVHSTCLSFLSAMDTAAAFITSERYKKILIVSSDIGSVGQNWKKPEVASLFGDGAAAVVVAKSEGNQGILSSYFASYSEGSEYTKVAGCGIKLHPNEPETTWYDNVFDMDGEKVVKLVRQHKDNLLKGVLCDYFSFEDVDWIVPHQASRLGILLLRRWGWPESKIIYTLEKFGNCIAASIPITLYEGIKNNKIQRGDKVLLIGTGAGLSMGGMIFAY